jgi:hypothetical protein
MDELAAFTSRESNNVTVPSVEMRCDEEGKGKKGEKAFPLPLFPFSSLPLFRTNGERFSRDINQSIAT